MSQLTDNEVLTEFIGLTPEGYYDEDVVDDYYLEIDGFGAWYKVHQLPYSSSFSALMPVWHKFNALRAPEPFDEHWNQMKEHKDCIGRVILHHSPVPTLACALLANAIRWYQSVKK
jgi:hypothetical protein